MALTDEDLGLKLKVSALLRRLQYSVFQEVDLCTYSYQPKYARRQVTDFDVLGVRVEADFSALVAVAECKSAEEQAMLNLLKLNGVKEFFHADKAYFVQRRIDLNAREIGRDLGIWVLDESNLEALMHGVGVSEREVETEIAVYKAKDKALRRQKRDLAKLTDYLKYDFWTLPEHRNIINIIRLATKASSFLDSADRSHVAWAHQVATNLGLAIVRYAGEIVRHNISDIKDGGLTRLLGGPRERRDREVLFDNVTRVVPESGLTVTPPFFEALIQVVARLINASHAAAGVVNCLDHLTRRTLSERVDEINGTAAEIYGDHTLKLSRDIVLFLTAASGLTAALFEKSLVERQ